MHPKKVPDVYQLDPFLLLVGVGSRDEQGTIRGGGRNTVTLVYQKMVHNNHLGSLAGQPIPCEGLSSAIIILVEPGAYERRVATRRS